MKIPLARNERDALFRNLVRECEVSRNDRRELHRRMRMVYLNGQDSSEPALYNRIQEFVDTSASYIYDSEGARFEIALGEQYGDDYLEETAAAAEFFQRQWLRHYTLRAAQAVEWAHPFPSTVCKVFSSRNRPTLAMLDDPADLSVWQEDVMTLADQEAMVHHYHLSVPAFERFLAKHHITGEGRANLMAVAREHATRAAGGGSVLPPTQSRIITAAVSPNMVGAAEAPSIVSMAQPNSDAPVIPLAELWVWDDDANDWCVATLFRPIEAVLLDGENPQPGIDPFYQLCLFPTNGYLWGLSPIERMVGLQQERSQLLADITLITRLNLDPPRAYLGISGMTDEKANRLRSPGGVFTSTMPNGDIHTLAPAMPPDAWTLVDGYDRMFNRAGGLPPGADVGAETAGVRAGDQLDTLATLGSPRTRKRAMYVEAFLNSVATALLKMHRRGPVRLVKPTSREAFMLAQIPGDLEATVAAHSASPLYAERTFERALLVYDRGAIDDEELVSMSGLPGQSRLRAKARQIMKAKAERGQQMSDLKKQEIDAKTTTAKAKLMKV